MKKIKRLALAKETLQRLDGSNLRLFGGEPITGVTFFCDTMGGSCQGASCAFECTFQAD